MAHLASDNLVQFNIKQRVRTIRCAAIAMAVAAAGVAPAKADDDDGQEFEQQDFLFQLEEAYTQEAGEWQIGAKADFAFDPWTALYELEVEYGLTDRLQVSVELPIVDGEEGSGVGDMEFAVDYALVKDQGGRAPELTVGFGASAPTGEADDGTGAGAWGYEASFRASKQVVPTVYAHALFAYEWVPDGGPDADALSEWAVGAGLAWRAADDVALLVEYLREREREEEDAVIERETESYLSAGVVLEVADDVEIGAAGAVGLNDDSADARALIGFQVEW